jgi:hypothetical protein
MECGITSQKIDSDISKKFAQCKECKKKKLSFGSEKPRFQTILGLKDYLASCYMIPFIKS